MTTTVLKSGGGAVGAVLDDLEIWNYERVHCFWWVFISPLAIKGGEQMEGGPEYSEQEF